jgi:hypothetical protein
MRGAAEGAAEAAGAGFAVVSFVFAVVMETSLPTTARPGNGMNANVR